MVYAYDNLLPRGMHSSYNLITYLLFYSSSMQTLYLGLDATQQFMQFLVGTHKIYLPKNECYELSEPQLVERLSCACQWFTSYIKLV